jgi:hypothetical protein
MNYMRMDMKDNLPIRMPCGIIECFCFNSEIVLLFYGRNEMNSHYGMIYIHEMI